jgi:short-subunit dehydrogenase
MKLLFLLLLVFSSLMAFAFKAPLNYSQDSVFNPPYALVAGGSKGIGYAIAEALAKRGFNLVLIARHEGPLLKAKESLESKYKIHVEVLARDLALEKTAEEIADWCNKRNLRLKVLCNVAGLGGSRDYLSLPLDTLQYMVRLNVESCMALTLTLLPLLERNVPSYVLNVASMAGFAPIPSKSMYASTKSAVIFFSYGLRYQLKDKLISVSCLAPGPVFTKQSVIDDTKKNLGSFGMHMAVSPSRVGEIAVKKMLRRKMIIVPGTLARISSSVLRIVPKRITASFYYRVSKKKSK